MKRRRFLTLFGAALTTPALPLHASAAPAAAYSRYLYGLAVFHARTHAHVSVRGLALRLKVTPTQAQAMLGEMSAAGIVRPVGATGTVLRATSNILRPDAWGLDAASRRIRTARRQIRLNGAGDNGPSWAEPDLSAFLEHLRRLCAVHGHPPRTCAVRA